MSPSPNPNQQGGQNPLLVIAHGVTDFNIPNPDRVLGWMDRPLTPEGQADAQKFAQTLSSLRGRVHSIVSSPLQRAVQSAQPIGQLLGLQVQTARELLPWNLGQLQGRLSEEVHDLIKQYMGSPDSPVPGGESENAWLQRLVPYCLSMIQRPTYDIMMTHSRCLDVIRGLAATKGQGVDQKFLKSDTIKPFDHFYIYPDYRISATIPVDDKIDSSLSAAKEPPR